MSRARASRGTPAFSPAEVSRFRLARHGLLRPFDGPRLVDAVRAPVGIQAQLLAAAYLSLRARVSGLREADVDHALEGSRGLVRTWAFRGTVHILAARDLPMCASVMRATVARGTDAWLLRSGLRPAEVEAIVAAVAKALEDGPLTRKEITAAVGPRFPKKARTWLAHGWGGLLQPLCFRGVACFGPRRGREITFVLRDRWLRSWEEIPFEEALAELFRRYLQASGPAALSDFTAWSGVRAKDLAPLRGLLGDRLADVTVDGRALLALREDLDALRGGTDRGTCVRLLPNFDAFLLGHRDKSHLVDPAHYKRVYRKAGWISPVVLVDGRAAGVWSHVRKGEKLVVSVDAFRTLGRAVRSTIEEEASDLGRFFQCGDVSVAFTGAARR